VTYYLVFDVPVTHKKSSFLVVGSLFGLHEDLVAFLCSSLSFFSVDPILVSMSFFPVDTILVMVVVIAAEGTSFQFRLIVGFLVIERVFMDCSIVLAILSLPR